MTLMVTPPFSGELVMNLIKAFTGIVAVALLATAVRAGSIGVNFVGEKPADQKLPPEFSAGVAAVVQSHWNNMTVSNDDPNGHYNEGKLEKVVNERGKDVDKCSVQVGGDSKARVWPLSAADWGFDGGDKIFHIGAFYPQPQITVSNVPYKKYDVYVYMAAGANGGVGSVSIAAKDDGAVDKTNTQFYKYTWQDGQYHKSEATTKDAAQDSKGSNYIVFSGNTAKSFALNVNGKLGGGWTGCAGIQIVEAK
jgi:hypothetical protein